MLKSISTLSKKRASEEDTPLSKAAKKAKRQLEQELAATATADKKGPKASQFCGDIPEAAEKEFYAKYAAGTPKLCFYDTLSKAPGYEAWINMCPNHRPGHKTGKCLLSHCGGHLSTTVIPSDVGEDYWSIFLIICFLLHHIFFIASNLAPWPVCCPYDRGLLVDKKTYRITYV
jgi:hypothetical protein